MILMALCIIGSMLLALAICFLSWRSVEPYPPEGWYK